MAVNKTKLAYERRYSDGSGVEYGVYYDSNATATCADHVGEFTIEHIDNITFGINEIDWLIECLRDIQSEVAKAKG